MLAGPIRELADSIFEFEPRFNDKIASLFAPGKGRKLALTRSQGKALVLLRLRSGATATELGEALAMTKASLTGILDLLEGLGLVARSADPGDRRKVRVSLTAEGVRHCDEKMREFDRRLEARMAGLSDEDRLGLARHLAGAAAILEKLGEE